MEWKNIYRVPEHAGSFGGIDAVHRSLKGKGTFYPQELQKVSDSGFYPVENVIKTRKRNGKSEYLVKFQGYPEKFNAWLVTVPSFLFPENKISHFMTQLPLRVTLNNGEWEVGLVDLIYPHTWYNIRNDNNIFGSHVDNGELLVRRVPLGFEPGEYKKSVESPYIADPTASFPVMYAYCNLIEPQIIGHIQAPLLKIIKVEGKDGKVANAQDTRRTCYSTTLPND
ncbi:uncharacterized transposon-derived protein F54H12.3 [Trichonephila inaurata madagascariensis]|uniref:Uncharacterized transposon-derived protein F54H12.3 n=1 Tax=Trichonephila inaurata madagascariensis TaxID=2747483 RepID=A0A8X7CKZ0_9ARAC|nr:uncharacterized transposon-derived protein F54H12.3 [Trichonephila inaurata madagascariensis]